MLGEISNETNQGINLGWFSFYCPDISALAKDVILHIGNCFLFGRAEPRLCLLKASLECGVAGLARWVVRQERLDRTNTHTRPQARNTALLHGLSQLVWIFIKHKLFVS